MLDINLIRHRPEWVKEQIAKRNDKAPINEILVVDAQRRGIVQDLDDKRRQLKETSNQIGRWLGTIRKMEGDWQRVEAAGDALQASHLRGQLNALEFNADSAKGEATMLGDQIGRLEEDLRQVDARFRELLLWVPNIPHASTPVGMDESANVHHAPQGAPLPQFDFEPRPHWELGLQLGIIDFERGVKLSGSRFYVLNGWGARLQRALIQFMLDYHGLNHGYTEIYPPFMVRSAVFEGAGQLPKFFDNIYRDAEEDFMWLATAEVALANLHRDEILEEDDLPRRYVAYTPCWRREKMSAGKDVRGIKRLHQFDKVEMFQYVHPSVSYAVHDQMRQHAADICEALGFHYRLVDLCSADIGFAMTRTIDIEVWAAGCQEWLEVSSISNAEDFQARRANVKYRPKNGGKLLFPHTLNASGLALPRVMIAILENNQQADGSVIIPPVLRPYMGGVERIDKPA